MSGGQEEAFELFNRAVLCHVLPVGLLLADQLIQLAEFLFLPEESIIVLRGAADCWHTTYYVANYSAEVCYEDGIFTLWNFHHYS